MAKVSFKVFVWVQSLSTSYFLISVWSIGEKWFAEGKRVLDQMETWVNCQKKIFENKLILMEEEHYASMCNVVAAKESYELSIAVALDNGFIHEQGIA